MAVQAPSRDASELQKVLTRFVDSVDGYRQAAAAVGAPDLIGAFLEISSRRVQIVSRLARWIAAEGVKSDLDSSPEAALHRWWLKLRADLSDNDLHAVLAECVRGEKELRRTLHGALETGELDPSRRETLIEIEGEVTHAIETFRSAID